ncbi:MAG: PQQ-binding-like beta-propeller repeat protein [Cyclobacteriaceae bacterium]
MALDFKITFAKQQHNLTLKTFIQIYLILKRVHLSSFWGIATSMYLLTLLLSCSSKDSWEVRLENTGTMSSFRAVNLNNDDVLDLVIGAGYKENESSDNGVLALDGKDGRLIWTVPCRNQMFGMPLCKDLSGDSIPEVFIGGRSAQFMAIDGASGKVLWEYLSSTEGIDPEDTTLLNFYNAQFIPDQDGDGLDDIINAFGGYVPAGPEEYDRPQGYLMVFSSKTGKVLVKAPMPDGKETYFSPIVIEGGKDGDPMILFGSGGETISGDLYIIRLSELMQGNLTGAQKIADGKGFGFMAPPVLADITADGIRDIVINAFGGRILAIDGESYQIIWENRLGYKIATFSGIVPLHINDDGIIDFFSSYAVGVWNDYQGTEQIAIDGATGDELARFRMGAFEYSSPVVADFSRDGFDDVLLHINNKKVVSIDENSEAVYSYSNQVLVFDLRKNVTLALTDEVGGSNFINTPLIHDLDGDKKIDILLTMNTDTSNIFSGKELFIQRKELNIPLNNLHWNAYMGVNGDAIYDQDEPM